ncbi:MAG: AbrB/MazE/SpoVT family DNA-binding domain-containing protein [Armatimonadota bacterium]
MNVTEDERIEDAFHGTVTVGERGQVVIPAEARNRFGISAGDKLLVFGHSGGPGLMMVKIAQMAEFIAYMEHLVQQENNEQASEDAE